MSIHRLSNNYDLSDEQIKESLGKIKCWLLDMDGTVTLGEELIPGAENFFEKSKDKNYIFVTNNSSHGPDHYLKRLSRLEIKADRNNLIISTDALIENIWNIYSAKEEVFSYLIGTPEFEKEITGRGIKKVISREKRPDCVLVGFDTTLDYKKLDDACFHIRSGVPYYGANPDKVCPLKGDLVMPDCGAIMSFLETCTGKKPERIFGKPDSAMIDMITEKYGYQRDQMAMVGDRIYTDIYFAADAGIKSICVLTGEAGLSDIKSCRNIPDFVFDNIGDIAKYM